MFFYFSKIFWFFCKPLNVIAIVFLAGLAFYKKPIGRKALLTGAGLFLFFGVIPVGPLTIIYLETQTQQPSLPQHVDGIIVLGGALNGEDSVYHHQAQINEWSERLTETMKLSRTYPQARIVYAGGSGSIYGQEFKESLIVKDMFRSIGLPTKRFFAEDGSRTTYENAANSMALAHPQAGENWLLVTSAFHMPRSRLVFEKMGWTIIPYPAGYIENDHLHLWHWFDVSGNYWKLNVAVKEIIGIIAYHISGRL